MPSTHPGEFTGARRTGIHLGARADRHEPRATTPDDVVPRLIGLGMSFDDASQLVRPHAEQQAVDALDALEELDARRRVADPIAWVDAAITQQWDLSGLLAERRLREQRLATLDTDRRQREQARDAYHTWRAVADRWDTVISAALDDDQLARAVGSLTRPLAGVGRHSVPVDRAELVTWAVAVHSRHPQTPLSVALAADLECDPAPAMPCPWPLPEPPTAALTDPPPAPLSARIGAVLESELTEPVEIEPALDVEIPSPRIRAGQDLG